MFCPLRKNPLSAVKCAVRTPNVMFSASTTLPAEETLTTAVYRFGASGDQSSGVVSLALAVKAADASAATDWEAASAVATCFPDRSRIFHETEALAAASPRFIRTVDSVSAAEALVTSART